MALVIPTIQSAPTYDAQAYSDLTDWSASVALGQLNGVISGGVASAGTGLAVNVSALTAVAAGMIITAGAVTNLALTAASATDRRDIIVCSSGGTISAVAGTACGTLGWTRASTGLPPVKPSIPAGSILLDEVYVPGNASSLSAGNLIDKTVLYVPAPGTLLKSQLYAPASRASYTLGTSLALLDATNATLAFVVPANGKVDIVVEAFSAVSMTTNNVAITLGLLNHTGGAQIGTSKCLQVLTIQNNQVCQVNTVTFHLTGQTPGALQLDLAAGRSNVAGGAASILVQGLTGLFPSTAVADDLLIQAKAA